MSFGFRKSFSSGPFRVTLSKSGLSTSFGAGGARVTSGPRGTHVSFSKGGFYYRTRIDQPLERRAPTDTVPPSLQTGSVPSPPRTEESASAPTELLGDTTPNAVVDGINRRIRRTNLSLPLSLLVSAAVFFLSVPWPFVLAIGAVSVGILHMIYHRSKFTSLVYENDGETVRRLEELQKGIAALRSSDSVWLVQEQQVENGLTPQPATLARTKIAGEPMELSKFLRTNISPARLQLVDSTLYFFPDQVLVWHRGRFSALDYSTLILSYRPISFLERETVPPDAEVKGTIKRERSGDGTLPWCRYSLIDIEFAPTLRLRLMTSSPVCADEFIAHLMSAIGKPPPQPSGNDDELRFTHFDPNCVPIYFDLTPQGMKQFELIRSAFEKIAQCDYVWRYDGEQATDDWKRNAGAGTLVTRSRIRLGTEDSGLGFETNTAFAFSADGPALLVSPSGYLAIHGGRFESLGKLLNINATSCSFREEEASPRDAQVVGTTWKFVNKSGGPDRRFNDNRQIPIYRYGQLEITAGNWRVRLCLSRPDAASTFSFELKQAFNQEQSAPHEKSSYEPPPKSVTPSNEPVDALRILGLTQGASMDQVSAAYRHLAAQNHPDKVAHMSTEFRELAERKMRELNAAYDKLRASYGHR